MKSLAFATFCFFALVKATMAASPSSLSVEIDADKLRYRVCLCLESEAIEYDSLDLAAPASGLAPRGARVHVKDSSTQMIACADTERGYSSAELYSGSPVFKSSFKMAPPSGAIFSEWFEIADLVRGLEQCSKISPEKWAKLQIIFTVRTRAKAEGSVQGQSVWLDLTPSARRVLTGTVAN